MFGYIKFENDVFQQMAEVFDKWTRENDDLYIFSLDCARGMDSVGVIANTTRYLEKKAKPQSEDYWYYKYCEEEWGLFNTFEDITGDMQKYLDENRNVFTNDATNEYSKAFDEHCNKIIECCQNALIRFGHAIKQNNSNILLTLNIREYLNREGRIKFFERINCKNDVKEYVEHIDEFA